MRKYQILLGAILAASITSQGLAYKIKRYDDEWNCATYVVICGNGYSRTYTSDKNLNATADALCAGRGGVVKIKMEYLPLAVAFEHHDIRADIVLLENGVTTSLTDARAAAAAREGRRNFRRR